MSILSRNRRSGSTCSRSTGRSTGPFPLRTVKWPAYAPSFQRFVDWVGAEEVKIYSWSMSDIKQLRAECRYKLPDFDTGWLDARWVDLQQKFDDRLGLHNNLALKYALGAMDHDFEGRQHTALDDAINTGAILVLMQDDAKFRRVMQGCG